MDNLLVASTRQEGLRPVGTGGQLAIHAHDQIARYLRRTLSDAHADLLAEPNFNPSRGTIDWYAPSDATIVRLDAVDPMRRRAVEDRLARLRDDILGRATLLSHANSGGDRHLGEMLRLALEVPDEQSIYCAGSRPVLVCWGTLRDEPDPPRNVLQRFVAYTPPPEPAAAATIPPPEPTAASGPTTVMPVSDAVRPTGGAAAAAIHEPDYVEQHRPLYWLGWLLWLLFGLLVVAILLLLLSGCGLRLPGFGWVGGGLVNYCSVHAVGDDIAESPELAAELARAAVLEQQIRQLELRIANERRLCPGSTADAPPVPQPPATAPPTPDAAPNDSPPAESVDPPTPPPTSPPADPPPESDEPPVNETPDGVETPPDTDTSPADDAGFDERLEREGAQRGDIGVTLAWDSDADLDLHVVCPDGNEIYFGRRAACGGELDVDMNVPTRMSEEPVENVFWPEGAAPPGVYQVIVNNYNTRNEGALPTPFRVRIINGGETSVHEGAIHQNDGPYIVTQFEVR